MAQVVDERALRVGDLLQPIGYRGVDLRRAVEDRLHAEALRLVELLRHVADGLEEGTMVPENEMSTTFLSPKKKPIGASAYCAKRRSSR